jgi:hypothetical protein
MMTATKFQLYTLPRVYLPLITPGSIYGSTGDLVCKTIELPYRNNARSTHSSKASCIEEGTYLVNKEPAKPTRNYVHFRLQNVKGRQGILIHKITYVKDLLGCIGVGGRHADLNADGVPDIVDSTKKMTWMAENMPDKFLLKIYKRP